MEIIITGLEIVFGVFLAITVAFFGAKYISWLVDRFSK